MAVRIYLLIITLDINELNAPIKRHRVTEWIRKQDSYTLPTRDSIHSLYDSFKDTQRQSKKMGKDTQCKRKQKAKVLKKRKKFR